jgi:hypothetical protein
MIEPSLSKNDLALWTSFVTKRSQPLFYAKFFSPRLLPFRKKLVADMAIGLLHHSETHELRKEIHRWLFVLSYAQPIHWNKNKLAIGDILNWVLTAEDIGMSEIKTSYVREVLIYHDPNGVHHNVAKNSEFITRRDKNITTNT